MEIALLALNCIKIKGKHSLFIVDPKNLKTKTPADAVVLLNANDDFDDSKIEESRVLIKAAGEYEFSGTKVSGIRNAESIVYDVNLDGKNIFLTRTEGLEKIKDKLKEYNIAVFCVDSDFDPSLITLVSPSVVVFYGEKAYEAVKSLGKDSDSSETVKPVSKFSVKTESLPEEMQVVLLQ